MAEYLDSDDAIAEYLAATLEDDNSDVFLAALGDIAKARGMVQIAEAAGLGREVLIGERTTHVNRIKGLLFAQG